MISCQSWQLATRTAMLVMLTAGCSGSSNQSESHATGHTQAGSGTTTGGSQTGGATVGGAQTGGVTQSGGAPTGGAPASGGTGATGTAGTRSSGGSSGGIQNGGTGGTQTGATDSTGGTSSTNACPEFEPNSNEPCNFQGTCLYPDKMYPGTASVCMCNNGESHCYD